MEKTIVAKECRFVVHVPSRSSDIPDVHIIKEVLHYNDNTSEPNVRLIKDFKRPFWITKPTFRNHDQKKEWEDESKLLRKEVTQSNLYFNIARMLNLGPVRNPRDILGNPYVYGADIHSSTFIKNKYSAQYPNIKTPYTVATLDIETDVVEGTKDIIMCTVACGNKILTVINKQFITGIGSPMERLKAHATKYLGEHIEKDKLDIVFHIAEDPVDLIKVSFNQLHTWKPDTLAIWNMNYDIPQILAQLEKYKADPKIYLCDPSVPYEYRVCNYKEGITKKVTASGQVKPLNPALQWHTLELTASFYVLDAMCVYRRLRMAKQEEPSYALDAILNKELGVRKLKFTETDKYSGLKWHQVMQQDFKLEYVIYNIYDAYSMLQLEAKTKDLSFSMPSLASNTPFSKFNSQPKLIADAFFFFLLEEKRKILASVGRTPVVSNTFESDEDDEDSNADEHDHLDLKNWIMTLISYMTVPGLKLIEEDSSLATNIRCFVSDLDASAAYPSAVLVANVSKENTVRELCSIKNIPEDVFRLQNLNFVTGEVNAIEYAETMFSTQGLLDFDSLGD